MIGEQRCRNVCHNGIRKASISQGVKERCPTLYSYIDMVAFVEGPF